MSTSGRILNTIAVLAGRTIRGIRDTIPGGYVLGRLNGDGPVQLLDLGSIATAFSQQYPAPKPANPTATAADAAVNGTANTYMRSDAAPAVRVATQTQLGLVQPDGTIITVAAGVITVPKATASVFGVVEPDGTTITASSGVLSAVSSGGNMLPLVNGDTPGPAAIADSSGQYIGVPL